MWRSFVHENEPFLVKVVQENDTLQVKLSNLKYLWGENIELDHALMKFEELNPSFQSTKDGLTNQLLGLINDFDKAVNIKMSMNESSAVTIFSIWKLENFEIKFEFSMLKLSEEAFFSEVTVPLMKTIRCLEKSNQSMIKILKKKDRELEEYRLEKGNISREDLVTSVFNENDNVQNENLILNLFNQNMWSKYVQDVDEAESEVNSEKPQFRRRPVKRKMMMSRKTFQTK